MARQMRPFLLLLLALAGLASAPAARADSWAPAMPETYVSPDGSARLKVTPRGLAGNLRYFEDLESGRAPAGQRPGSAQASAHGVVELRTPEGGWTELWRGPLANDVAPVRALVADGGRYVVTFDNWHFVGVGENVVVIYDSGGRIVRSLALGDFLPTDYIAALPRSVSSLYWGGEHRISGDRLILSVRVPSDEGVLDRAPAFVELGVDLASGRPEPLTGPAWERALATGAQVHRANLAAEAAQTAFFAAPLIGPSGADERDWYQYTYEAFHRLDPDWRENSAATTVLRAPGAANYAISRTHLREALRDTHGAGDLSLAMMFASPSQRNLADVLATEVARLPARSLRGIKIYVVASDDIWPRMIQIFARSGAELVQVDPTEPIPQRPERIRLREGGVEPAPS